MPAGIALTFDDGPVPGATEQVLDTLMSLGVSATFFCVGRNAQRHPGLVRRLAEEGHTVGSHSMSHAPRGLLSEPELVADYLAGRHAVEDALGEPVPLFRPPYGRLSLGTLKVMRSFESWTWTVDPQDWRTDTNRREIAGAVARARPGDVVLLHDWVEQESDAYPDRTETVAALPWIARSIARRGIPFVTLGRLRLPPTS